MPKQPDIFFKRWEKGGKKVAKVGVTTHNGLKWPEINSSWLINMGMGQNPIPLVNIKMAGKWMFIPLKMVCIGIDP